jgi:hypothetical protein
VVSGDVVKVAVALVEDDKGKKAVVVTVMNN